MSTVAVMIHLRLDASNLDHAAQPRLDDGGLGVAQDHMAFAFVGSGGGWPSLRQLRLHDQFAELALQDVKPVDWRSPLPLP